MTNMDNEMKKPLPGSVQEPLPANVRVLSQSESDHAQDKYHKYMEERASLDKSFIFPKPVLEVIPIIGNIYPDEYEAKILTFFKNNLSNNWYVWVDQMEDYAKFEISDSDILFSWIAKYINIGEVIAINKSDDFLILFDSYMNYSTYAFSKKIAQSFFGHIAIQSYFLEKFNSFLNANEGGFDAEDSKFIKTYYYPMYRKGTK